MSNSSLFFLSFGEKGGVRIPGSPPLLAMRVVYLWTPSLADTFCPQQGSQKGNTENQRHLVATGALNSCMCIREHMGDRMSVTLEEGNDMLSPQLGS